VIPALIRKCEEARIADEQSITCWGTGSASREFLYVDDCAQAIVTATERYDSPEPVNIGVGKEITIRELVELITRVTGFDGEIRWDTTKPDGQPRRVLDTTRAEAEIGFHATTSFEDGLRTTVEWFRQHAPRAEDRVLQ
jgi:nucleoside-diphosphate-sugar epimerase